MKNPKYALEIDLIEPAAEEFVSKLPDLTVSFSDVNGGGTKMIDIRKDKDHTVLNCFIMSGQVSHNVQGSNPKLNEVGEACWNYILDNTKLPDISKKAFSARNIRNDDFDVLMQIMSENPDINVSQVGQSAESPVRNLYHLTGKYNARLTVTFYKNGTLMVQGPYSAFFIEFINEAIQAISNVPIQAIEEVVSVGNPTTIVIDPDLSIHIKDLTHVAGSVVEVFLKTSIVLVNNPIKLGDYGCFSFGALKALDAIMRSRIQEGMGDFEKYGDVFSFGADNAHHFNRSGAVFDSTPHLKDALEKAYSYFRLQRHTSFHVDPAVESSRLVSYDDAVNITRECLVLINRICDNW